MACAGVRHFPYPVPPDAKMPNVGANGLIKIKRANGREDDVFGEVTNAKYAFSNHTVLYVDVRDAVYLLGKDFILGS